MNCCMMYGFIAGIIVAILGMGGSAIIVQVWINKGINK